MGEKLNPCASWRRATSAEVERGLSRNYQDSCIRVYPLWKKSIWVCFRTHTFTSILDQYSYSFPNNWHPKKAKIPWDPNGRRMKPVIAGTRFRNVLEVSRALEIIVSNRPRVARSDSHPGPSRPGSVGAIVRCPLLINYDIRGHHRSINLAERSRGSGEQHRIFTSTMRFVSSGLTAFWQWIHVLLLFLASRTSLELGS